MYIVDHGIPEEPARERVQFYRDLENLRKIYQGGFSIVSVVCTEDEVMAEAIYLLVRAHGGKGHVYRGEEVTETVV